jgi:hypothetical protein
MFGFLPDFFNHEERQVARFEGEDSVIDTARVSDGQQPYETGIAHPEYNDGKWVIVEAYPDKATALFGHGKWVKLMTAGALPVSLEDCGNSEVSQVIETLGGEMIFPRTVTERTDDGIRTRRRLAAPTGDGRDEQDFDPDPV